MPPLCAPNEELSCFGCCPPIRPHHYDPLDFVGSLRREFIENRRAFLNSPLQVKPILGYHCWALGFLDSTGRMAGCLLHPSRNAGKDLRELVDYGNKCRRESCRPAQVFEKLPPESRIFWLSLVRGLNTFSYSSHRANPLFHLLLWGPELLEKLRDRAGRTGCSATELIYLCPFLLWKAWKPQAHRFVFMQLLDRLETKDRWGEALEKAAFRLLSRIPELEAVRHLKDPLDAEQGIWTHQSSEGADLLDFLRLELSVKRVTVVQLKKAKDAIQALAREMPV